jgi:hypothetical protein
LPIAALLPSRQSFTAGVAAKPGGQMLLLLLLLLLLEVLLLLLLCKEGMLMVAASRIVPLLVSTTCNDNRTENRQMVSFVSRATAWRSRHPNPT